MDLLKTVLIYMSMLFISSVQIAPDPSTVNVTPSPVPTPYGIVATATPVPTPTPTPVPTPNITPNAAYGELVMGDRDQAVRDLQQKLSELGYYTGEIDGAYGNITRRAVEQFQYQNGLAVDGIAGMYTQTVLYESDEVKPAPTEVAVTDTPAFYPDETVTPPPATVTPIATIAPTPTVTPAPTAAPDANVPALMDSYDFVLAGFSDPLTVQGSEIVLHPAELDSVRYVPLIEILKDAGNIIIANTDGGTEELVFTVLTDIYQVSYTLDADGGPSNLVLTKNAEPQPMTTRGAILLNGVFYLPLDDVARITGIEFTVDDAGKTVTVTMPSAG